MTTRTDWAALRTRAIDAQIRNPKSAFPETPLLLVVGLLAAVVVYLYS